VGAEHVNGADDDAPDRQDAGDLDSSETDGGIVVFKGGEKDKDFTGEIGKAWQSERGHGGDAEDERELGSGFGKAAEIFEVDGAGGALDAVGEAEEQGDGNAVGEHQDNG